MPEVFNESSVADSFHHRGQRQIRLHRHARNVESADVDLRKNKSSADRLLQISIQISACRRGQARPILIIRMKYFDEMCRAMEFLAQDKRTIFLGQAVACPGTAMSNTLKNVDPKKLLELPVTEEMQMGMSTGLALGGHVP